MPDPFIGELTLFAGNFAPRGWALCDGQLLDISQNSALFSILGTTYGGDGRTTFALPDLRGRVAMHPGRGAGLTPRNLGQKGGEEAVTLSVNQIPSHDHQVNCNALRGDAVSPQGNIPASDPDKPYKNTGTDKMSANMIANTGGNQSHDNMQPFNCINYIIALEGIYPSRS